MNTLRNGLTTVVMAAFLGDYTHAAKERRGKFRRAVRSLQEQTCNDWELIVVCDGCEIAWNEATGFAREDERVSVALLPKQPQWSSALRNYGIVKAEGEFITYLDTDDYLSREHIYNIRSTFVNEPLTDWLFFDDFVFDVRTNSWRKRNCYRNRRHQCGTSNIAHRKSLGVYWPNDGYLHDWYFIKALEKKSTAIGSCLPGYYVCHIPQQYDV